MGKSEYFDTNKVWCTFTYVIVDLVSWGTGDQSLTDVTPCSVHAALIQLAVMCGQTLIYVWKFKKKEYKGQMCQCDKRELLIEQ